MKRLKGVAAATAICAAALAGRASAQAAAAPTRAAPQKGSANGLTVSGGIRVRVDAIDGQFRPTAPASDAMLSIRSTIAVTYRADALLIGGELMDSRTYLQKPDSSAGTTEVNTLEPIQAYVGVSLDGLLGGGSHGELTVGRFTQDIGSRRLVSRQAFRNSTNAYAGARFTYAAPNGDRAILFWSMPQVRLPNDRDSILDNDFALDRQTTDVQLYGGSYTRAHVGRGTLEAYAYGLAERDAPRFPTRNRRLITPGVRWAVAPAAGRFDTDLEAIYQHGRTRASTAAIDITDLSVSAWFVHAELGHTFTSAWHPRIAVQYDRASGDGRRPDTFNRFDTLYGARRFEYGPTSLYGAIARANLSSPSLRVEAVPTKKLDGFLAYRALWLDQATDSFSATEIRDRSGRSGRFAGHQIEGRARYWLKPKTLRLESGFAYLLKGAFLRNAPNVSEAGDTRYLYTDLSYTF